MTKHRCIVLFIVSPIINICAAPLGSCRNFIYDKLFNTAIKIQEQNESYDKKAIEFRNEASFHQKIANIAFSVATVATFADLMNSFRTKQTMRNKLNLLLLTGFNLAYFKISQIIKQYNNSNKDM